MTKEMFSKLPTDVLITGDAKSGIVTVSGKQLFPAKSQKVINHSPDGFSWGYGGSGPSQLALAILLEFMPEKDAVENYQKFKWNVIATLNRDSFAEHINLQEDLK